MTRHLIIVIAALAASACASGPDSTRPQGDTTDPAATARFAYVLATAAWTPVYRANGSPDLFQREVFAQSKVAWFWGERKASEPSLSDPQLDALLRAHQAGYTAEHVWTHLRQDDWTATDDLRLDAFRAWERGLQSGASTAD